MKELRCFNAKFRINKISNIFSLTGNTFKPELHLKQAKRLCSACGLFSKNRETIQKLKETGNIYNESN